MSGGPLRCRRCGGDDIEPKNFFTKVYNFDGFWPTMALLALFELTIMTIAVINL